MSRLRWLLWVFIVAVSPARAADDLAARTVVLANSADPDSLRIAQHYAGVRGVPSRNVIALTMPPSETISWAEFVQSIWNPLRAELIAHQWIDGIPMDLADEAGRRKYATSGHRIAYLVVCRGVPLRIRHDPALYKPAPPMTDNVIFRTNSAAVDGELSLLAHASHAINAYLTNPLFNNDRPSRSELSNVLKVSRLDGPTVETALRLPDLAMAAERLGVRGRAYVDIGGNHPQGDRWLESVAQQLQQFGFETDVDRAPTTIAVGARFDEPVIYFGWYESTVKGPFTKPGFQFPRGAIALHIHSYSATSLRDAESGWCGPFVAKGVTATVGNVFEPYLQLTHRPDLLFRALARGENWGDAVSYSQPALSWQVVAIGDPLYRPFRRSPGE